MRARTCAGTLVRFTIACSLQADLPSQVARGDPIGRRTGRRQRRFAAIGFKVTKILRNHYARAVHDLERSRDWYERVLGCTTEVIDEGNWLFFRRDQVTFMCGRCPGAIDPQDLGDHQYFAYLVVDDVDAFFERAAREGADILKAPRVEPWGMREMALRTVDGHRMMIAEPLAQSG